jgi:hypothetical protein
MSSFHFRHGKFPDQLCSTSSWMLYNRQEPIPPIKAISSITIFYLQGPSTDTCRLINSESTRTRIFPFFNPGLIYHPSCFGYGLSDVPTSNLLRHVTSRVGQPENRKTRSWNSKVRKVDLKYLLWMSPRPSCCVPFTFFSWTPKKSLQLPARLNASGLHCKFSMPPMISIRIVSHPIPIGHWLLISSLEDVIQWHSSNKYHVGIDTIMYLYKTPTNVLANLLLLTWEFVPQGHFQAGPVGAK